jgi:hypothetical protein
MTRSTPSARWPAVVAALLVLAAVAAAVPARAADRGRGAECAAIDDPTARLACYDAAFPRPARPAAAAAAAPKVVAVPAPATAALQPAIAADKFGLSERQREALEPKPEKPPANTLTAAVTAVRKLPSGHLLIDLDNDQQWQQIESAPNLYLRTGDRVTIRKAALGSFLLQTASNYSVRVRRIR